MAKLALKPAPTPERTKMGRPPFVPTADQRTMVRVLRSFGISAADIAREWQCGERTIDKYFQEELAHGKASIHIQIGNAMVQKALAGNMAAMIFMLKTQFGWREIAPPKSDEESGVPPVITVRIIGGLPD